MYESKPQLTKDLLHWQTFQYFHEADDNAFGQQTSGSMDFQVGYKNEKEDECGLIPKGVICITAS